MTRTIEKRDRIGRGIEALRARFLEDAEPVVIVIDYNVIARSLFGSSFATWSILELSVLTIITAKGYWGTF